MRFRMDRGLAAGMSVALAAAITGCVTKEETTPSDEPAQVVASSDSTQSLGTGSVGMASKPEPIRLQPGAPDSYTVTSGDTLWSIAERFLLDPWL